MSTREQVQDYYGKVLASSDDLQTDACKCGSAPPAPIRAILAELHPEIIERFYGCGSPIPEAVEGCTVLDLGCGSGRDSYVLAKLVGEAGQVIGLDMTPEQLAVAQKHVESQTRIFGFKTPNIRFVQGYIEDLTAAGIADNSMDIVISNCVVNLSPDKGKVLSEIVRVLKPGGELFFSDVFSDRRIPETLRQDPVFYGECLGGALYVQDFRRMLAQAGIADHRIVQESPLALSGKMRAKAGAITFSSLTVRAFKLAGLEDACEDYGQTAVYLGTLPGHAEHFTLDQGHDFVTGRPAAVCGNTADMLSQTRFAPHFQIRGDRSIHYGIFADCGSSEPSCCGDTKSKSGCC